MKTLLFVLALILIYGNSHAYKIRTFCSDQLAQSLGQDFESIRSKLQSYESLLDEHDRINNSGFRFTDDELNFIKQKEKLPQASHHEARKVYEAALQREIRKLAFELRRFIVAHLLDDNVEGPLLSLMETHESSLDEITEDESAFKLTAQTLLMKEGLEKFSTSGAVAIHWLALLKKDPENYRATEAVYKYLKESHGFERWQADLVIKDPDSRTRKCCKGACADCPVARISRARAIDREKEHNARLSVRVLGAIKERLGVTTKPEEIQPPSSLILFR